MDTFYITPYSLIELNQGAKKWVFFEFLQFVENYGIDCLLHNNNYKSPTAGCQKLAFLTPPTTEFLTFWHPDKKNFKLHPPI